MIGRRPYGLVAAFETAEPMLHALRSLRELGFRAIDTYTPVPIEEGSEMLRAGHPGLLHATIAAGAVVGGGLGYFIQYWDEVLSYPINVGGRPYDSWPAFIVSAFELTLLGAAAFGFVGLWLACRLPRLHHPLFAAEGFERASQDRFVICVEARDPGYEPGMIRRVLEREGASEIVEVAQ